jgi:DNA-directed RNA polymerase alpha subunit
VKVNKTQDLLPVKLAKPAQRALQGAGITSLKQLAKLSEKEISQWHGIGPNAIKEIKKALKDNGLSFAGKP